MPDQFRVVDFMFVKNACRTAAEQFVFREQLLVHFQSRHEPYAVVISLCCVLSGDVADGFAGLLVVGFRIESELICHNCESNNKGSKVSKNADDPDIINMDSLAYFINFKISEVFNPKMVIFANIKCQLCDKYHIISIKDVIYGN